MDFITSLIDINKVGEAVEGSGFLGNLQAKSGIPKKFLAIGMGILAVMVFLFGFGLPTLTNVVGFVYPLYASFKALKTEGKEDDKQWLTYWIVFGFFSVFESVMNIFFFFIPVFVYHMAKMIFLVACFHPKVRLATVIFNTAIDPFLAQVEQKVDEFAPKKNN